MVAVAGCLLVVALLVAWAAALGPGQVLTGDGPEPQRTTLSASASPTDVQTGDPTDRLGGPTDDNEGLALVVRILGLGLLAGMIAVFVAVIGFLAKLTWESRPRREVIVRESVDFDVVDDPSRVKERIVADRDAMLAILADGEPRNAIVRCWERFETLGSQAGVVRAPADTSSEYALRVLDLVSAEPHAVSTLAGLFREARFSEHPVGEAERESARTALERIHADLSGAGTGGRG